MRLSSRAQLARKGDVRCPEGRPAVNKSVAITRRTERIGMPLLGRIEVPTWVSITLTGRKAR